MGNKSHEATRLTRQQAEKLYEHVRAIEGLEAERKDLLDDINERKTLVTEQMPVQKDVLDFVLKRRKHSKPILNNFDTMLELVEEAIQEVETEHAEDTRERIAAAHRKHAAQSDFLEDDETENGGEDDELGAEPQEAV